MNSYFESINVGNTIALLLKSGAKASDIAVLYRNNSLSAPIEAELSNRGIPYAVYGGLKFFDRAEVQDALAYLRILLNDADDTALLRIINRRQTTACNKQSESCRNNYQNNCLYNCLFHYDEPPYIVMWSKAVSCRKRARRFKTIRSASPALHKRAEY